MNKPTVRDFRVGTIADLCKGVSALEYSHERLSELAAYPSGGSTIEATLGGIQAQKAQLGKKRTGGGGRSFRSERT